MLDYLCSLENVKTIILFGSFVRGDWYKDSDIDIFIYGESDLSLGKYLSKLKREIQVFSGKDEKDLKKFGAPLLKNIIKEHRNSFDKDFDERQKRLAKHWRK